MKNTLIIVLAALLIITGIILNLYYENIADAGQFVCNYFAVGQFAVGVFAAGTFSVGIFSIGIFSIGIFSLGIFNIGIYTIGFFLIGWRKRHLKIQTENIECIEKV